MRGAVAKSAITPTQIIDKLAKDPDVFVRERVSRFGVNLSDEGFDALSKDRTVDVRFTNNNDPLTSYSKGVIL